jgi:DNA-binding IclR family transcriptional regulator
MRRKRELTPTAQLILQAVGNASTPLSHADIAEATHASPYTVSHLTQNLVRNSLLRRNCVGGMSYFTLPLTDTAEVNRG